MSELCKAHDKLIYPMLKCTLLECLTSLYTTVFSLNLGLMLYLCLGLISVICVILRGYNEFQCSPMLETGQKACGGVVGGWWLKPILEFTLAQAE